MFWNNDFKVFKSLIDFWLDVSNYLFLYLHMHFLKTIHVYYINSSCIAKSRDNDIVYLDFYKRTQGIWRWHLETKPSISLNVTCVSNLFRFSADDAGSSSVIRVFQFIYAWDLSIIMTLQFSPSRMMTKHVFVTLISLTIVLHTVKHAKFPYAAFVYQPNTNHTRYKNCPIKLKNF